MMGDLMTLLFTLLVAWISWKVITFYHQLRHLPPGPFPLPVIGNLLQLRNKHQHQFQTFSEMSHKYGSTFTLFLGNTPTIIMTDVDTVTKALKNPLLAGRPDSVWTQHIYKPGSIDIPLSDYSREWEVVRRAGHMSFKLFASSPQLESEVIHVTDQVIETVINTPFESNRFMDTLVTTIFCRWCFGKEYNILDHDLTKIREGADFIQECTAVRVIAFAPFLKYLYWNSWKKFLDQVKYLTGFVSKEFAFTAQHHESGSRRTLCDTLLSMQDESDDKTKEYLSDDNLINVLFGVSVIGPDTLVAALRWCMLLMATYPETQEVMRQEVKMIGSDVPMLRDQKRLHHVMSFVMETLRYRPTSPMTDPHKATQDTNVGDLLIRKGTVIIMNLYNLTRNESIFPDADVFKPERFLSEEGKFTFNSSQMFEFGGGKRYCPGDKLAINVVFLIICRFLQKSIMIEIPTHEDVSIEGDHEIVDKWAPCKHLLLFHR